MPISFQIFADHRLIVAFAADIVREECVLDYFARVRAHPDYCTGLNRLVDNRNLVELDIGFAEMRNVRANELDVFRKSRHRVKTAFLFDGTESAGYGSARMYQSLAETDAHQDVAIFEDLTEALAFVDARPALGPEIEGLARCGAHQAKTRQRPLHQA